MTKRFRPEVLEQNTKIWNEISPETIISHARTVEEALIRARNVITRDDQAQVLITGSLHLISSALCLLEPDNLIH